MAAVGAAPAAEAKPDDDPKGVPPSTPAPAVADPLSGLRTALERLDRAARAAGVEEDDALGAWITSLRAVLECSATIALEGEARVLAAVAAFEAAAREDRLRMRQATERCNAETVKLARTFGTLEIRSHNMVTQVIETMVDQVAEKMRERLVIVERQHNARALWRQTAVLLVAVLVIFAAGSAVTRYADRRAVGLWDQCFANPTIDSRTGELWCAVGAPQTGR